MSTGTFAAAGVQETVVPLTSEHPLARVDLMPVEVLQGRRFRRARGWMGVAVVLTVLAWAGAWWYAAGQAAAAEEELAAEQARTAVLQQEAAQYARVPAILASVDRAEGALEIAMATDIEYYRYLAQLGAVTPDGVWFTDISFSAVPAGQVAADPLAPRDTVADLTIAGSALTYVDVAALLDAVDGVSGVDHPLFTGTTFDGEANTDRPFVEFQANAKLTPEAFSGRYDRTGE